MAIQHRFTIYEALRRMNARTDQELALNANTTPTLLRPLLLLALIASCTISLAATEEAGTSSRCDPDAGSGQQALVQASEAWLDLRLADARRIIDCHQLIEHPDYRADAMLIDALSAQYLGELEPAGRMLNALRSESRRAPLVSHIGHQDALAALARLEEEDPARLPWQLTDALFDVEDHHSVLATHAYGTWLATKSRFEEAYTVFRAGLDRLSDQGRDTPAMLPLLEGMADVYLLENRVGRRAITVLRRMADLTLDQGEAFTAEQKALAHIKLANHYLRFSMEDDAQRTYIKAWTLAPEGIRQTMASEIDIIHSQLRDLHPHDKAKAPWFDFRFDVLADGRPARVRLIDSQSSAEQVSFVRDRLLETRFRPLIIDGQAVRARQQLRRLTYRAIPIPDAPETATPQTDAF